VLIKSKLVFPEALVNLKRIPGLKGIEETADRGLRIGALCRHRDLERSPLVRERFVVLAEAASKVASPAVRNVGTVGGNLCHADSAADLPPALLALGAAVELAGPGGTRSLPLAEFFTDSYETALAPAEVLVEIRIPALPGRAGGAYVDLTKTHNSVAIVSAAAVVALDPEGKCLRAGLALAGVAATPLLVPEASELAGRALGAGAVRELAEAAAARARPVSNAHASAEYRRSMVGVVVRRAFAKALERAGGGRLGAEGEGEP
jgi:CO/xanthine dehydrogenase FAD-binding subunit